MKRIQFSIRYPERFVHPLHQQIIEQPRITQANLLMWSPTEDATTLFWFDGDLDATETVVESIDSLLVSHFVEDTDGTYVFLQQDEYEFSTALLDTIADSQVIFFPPVVFLDSGNVRFEAVGEPTALSTFHEKLSELGDLRIDSVHGFERKSSPSRLTERQAAALQAAVEVGYYEVPRDGTIADVATALNCSSSTAGELVRKAEAAVISDYIKTS